MPCFVLAAGHSFKTGDAGVGQAVVFTLSAKTVRPIELLRAAGEKMSAARFFCEETVGRKPAKNLCFHHKKAPKWA